MIDITVYDHDDNYFYLSFYDIEFEFEFEFEFELKYYFVLFDYIGDYQ